MLKKLSSHKVEILIAFIAVAVIALIISTQSPGENTAKPLQLEQNTTGAEARGGE